MSPHEEVPPGQQGIASLANLLESKFSVTKNGFLPAEAPLQRLPDPYYEPWENVAGNIPTLLHDGALRKTVDGLPILSASRLGPEPEWRRAYMILTFLTHAYIWGGETPSDRLPPQVTLPVLQVSRRLDLPAAVTYAAGNLWNFRPTSASGEHASFSDLDSLDCLLSFTGTRDESWFYMVSVAMECEGGHIIPTVLSAMATMTAESDNDPHMYETVTSALEQLMACIGRAGRVLERMHEHCEPEVFYHAIRPFLAGSKNMSAAGLPNGVFYDEGDGKGQWVRLRGGSNGQSSLIQFFDVVLGVEHAATENQDAAPVAGKPEKGNCEAREMPFHEEVRAYMPGPHRRFLEHVRALPSIRRLALQPLGADEPLLREKEVLRDTYQRATSVLAEFRNKHLQIVTRYIVVPSRKQQQLQQQRPHHQTQIGLAGWREPPQNPVAIPKATVAAPAAADHVSGGTVSGSVAEQNGSVKGGRPPSETQLTGTGGTALIPFLKQVRDETIRAGHPDSA